MNFNDYMKNPIPFLLLVIWDAIWRGQALWKSAKKSQKYWFIALLIVNSMGILPIIYLLIDKYSNKAPKTTK